MATQTSPKEHSGFTELIRKISSSHFNYWFGYVSNLLIVAFLTLQGFSGTNSLLTWYEWIYIPAIGLFTWTFLEYFLHKYAYHVWDGPFEKGHGLHHEKPYDLMGVPWYLTAVVIIGIYLNGNVLHILCAFLISRKSAHVQPIDLSGNNNCICIIFFTCVFNAGIHLPIWCTVGSVGKTYQMGGGIELLVQYWRLGKL